MTDLWLNSCELYFHYAKDEYSAPYWFFRQLRAPVLTVTNNFLDHWSAPRQMKLSHSFLLQNRQRHIWWCDGSKKHSFSVPVKSGFNTASVRNLSLASINKPGLYYSMPRTSRCRPRREIRQRNVCSMLDQKTTAFIENDIFCFCQNNRRWFYL